MLLSKKTAFLSILTVLCVLCMMLASFIKTNTIFFTLLASAFVFLGVYEYRISGGLCVYIASAVLGFLLVPDKNVIIFFAVFFGYYPILKTLTERINSFCGEWLLKLSAGTAAFFFIYYFFTKLFFSFEIKLPLAVLYIAAAVLFVIYDKALSLFLKFYMIRIKPYIKQ